MPKHFKHGSAHGQCKGHNKQRSKQQNHLQVKGKATKTSDKQIARLRAAAKALLNNVGCGGINRLLAETGAELSERGIMTSPVGKQQQHVTQAGHVQTMDAAQHQQPAQSSLSVFQSQHPNTPVAPKHPKPDINALLSGWSLHSPAGKDAQDAAVVKAVPICSS